MKTFRAFLFRFVYNKLDIIVASAMFILLNIISMIWEVYFIGVDWSDEWKVRLVSILLDVALSTPYVLFRKNLIEKISIKNQRIKMYISDTIAILAIYSILKIMKFSLFLLIGWISPSGLRLAIWSVIILAICFGRVGGLIIDRSKKFFQEEIRHFLEKRI